MKTILFVIAAISFFLIPAEAETSTLQIIWSGGWTLVFLACVKIIEHRYLTKEEKEERV